MTGYYVVLREVTAGDQLRLGPHAVDTGYNEGRVHLFFLSSWVVQNAVYNYSVQLENITISEGNTLCMFQFPVKGPECINLLISG